VSASKYFKAVVTIGLIASGWHSYAQKSSYTDQCVLLEDFFTAADSNAFRFTKMAKDSVVTILDVNGLLKDCIVTAISNFRLNVVDTGTEIQKIRKSGIFSADPSNKNVLVLTKNRLGGITGFTLFQPYSNFNYYWGFKQRRKVFILKKHGSGHF